MTTSTRRAARPNLATVLHELRTWLRRQRARGLRYDGEARPRPTVAGGPALNGVQVGRDGV